MLNNVGEGPSKVRKHMVIGCWCVGSYVGKILRVCACTCMYIQTKAQCHVQLLHVQCSQSTCSTVD